MFHVTQRLSDFTVLKSAPRAKNAMLHVTQKLSDFTELKSEPRAKNAGFDFWLYKINRNDRLPRGKFFIGKTKKTKPLIVFDEFWRTQ